MAGQCSRIDSGAGGEDSDGGIRRSSQYDLWFQCRQTASQLSFGHVLIRITHLSAGKPFDIEDIADMAIELSGLSLGGRSSF